MMTKIEQFRKIVDEKSAGEVDGISVDLPTATAVINLYDHLGPSLQERFARIPVDTIANFAWNIRDKDHG